MASGNVLARGGVHVYVGPGYYPYYGAPYPYWYDDPYYVAPQPIIVAPVQNDTYVEQSSTANTASGGNNSGVWYYCEKAGAYYPYVKTCQDGWKQVPAQPVATQPTPAQTTTK